MRGEVVVVMWPQRRQHAGEVEAEVVGDVAMAMAACGCGGEVVVDEEEVVVVG